MPRQANPGSPQEEIIEPRRYYCSRQQKLVLLLLVPVFLLSFLLGGSVLFATIEDPGSRTIIGLFYLASFTLYLAYVVWRLRTPQIEISAAGIKTAVFKRYSHGWAEIEGMAVGEMQVLGQRAKLLKIMVKPASGVRREITIPLKGVEKADEIVGLLRSRLPTFGGEQAWLQAVGDRRLLPESLSYKGWTLDGAGLVKGSSRIPWTSISEVNGQSLVVAGYGNLTLVYEDGQGKRRSLTLAPSLSQVYIDVVRFVMASASRAAIDPDLRKYLDIPPLEARKDLAAIAFAGLGFLLMVVGLAVLELYAPTRSASNIVLLFYAPSFLLFALLVYTLMGRMRGVEVSGDRKLLWSFLYTVATPLTLMLFLAIHPFSYHWLAGDVHAASGDYAAAEQQYGKALAIMQESGDVTYALGKLYFDQKRYEEAHAFFEKAYRINPQDWPARAYTIIPETLKELNRRDEALAWCDRLEAEHPGKFRYSIEMRELRRELEVSVAGKGGRTAE